MKNKYIKSGNCMFSRKRSEILNQKLEECLNLDYNLFEEIIMNLTDRLNLTLTTKGEK